MTNKIQIKEKDFGNKGKSRKGKYIYIKEPNKKGRYYKKQEGLKKEDYIKYYKSKIKSKKGGVTKKKLKKIEKYEKILKKYPKVETTLKSGYAGTTINNAKELTPYRMLNSYKRLLMNKDKLGDGHGIIRDKELLELITTSENIEKWKHRIMYETQIFNEKGELTHQINNTNVKTIGELKSEVIDYIQLGMEVGSFSDKMNEQQIEKDGWKISSGTTNKGKIKDIKIKMIFRKA